MPPGRFGGATSPQLNFGEALRRGLRLRCPQCGQGRLYANWVRMNHDCARCGLSFYRESGYYVGAMILNYVVTAAIALATYLISLLLPPLWNASTDARLMAWFTYAILLCLALMPHARSLWLAFDYWIEPWAPGPSGLL
jgi:uncharacterized protein (DUF983 family)